MKHILSVGAVIAALAVTGTAAFAQTTTSGDAQNSNAPIYGSLNSQNKDTATNSAIPGSAGYTGASLPAGAQGFPASNDGGITQAGMNALYGDLNAPNKDTETNSMIPGTPGYTGSTPPAGYKGFPTPSD